MSIKGVGVCGWWHETVYKNDACGRDAGTNRGCELVDAEDYALNLLYIT